MCRDILTNFTKIEDKKKILKATREKQQITYKKIPIKLTADFQQKRCKAEGRGRKYLK